ncbi:hypothetical protein CUN61_05390 [Pseudomonas arsenicoxydans]|uniref:Uncharacterized protein n=1 Tax=Pseudomonas arsenicoxydans TaxID=702115 RepID=A0A4P6FXA3_9PSED|nr:hypothetical protein CUN61_05390 [Pseudomonas arsenicoxydans]
MAKIPDRNSPIIGARATRFRAWNADPVGAGLPAKAFFRSMEMCRMYWPLREQAHSHKGYPCGLN